MTLTLSYEDKRDLLTGMLYKRSNTQVASRSYSYDELARPTSRGTTRDGQSVSDSFAYNNRSELTSATVSGESYAYDYDNIGNRETAQEAADAVTAYATNSLNQYTAIGDFTPTFDDAGNQTLVKTSTGIWAVTYDAENRPTLFSNAESSTTVECTYDYMGRRATKKVTVNGSVTLHQRYIYRGYLQIACCDLTRSSHPCLWLLCWDPTQTTATRPLAIQINGTWFTYGWDLTKNICEVYGQHGYIRTAYTYSPYGAVTMSGDLIQPIQWSSEYHDSELALVYYNYRHYNPTDGRWLGRDPFMKKNVNPMAFCANLPTKHYDIIGLCWKIWHRSNKRNDSAFSDLKYFLRNVCTKSCCHTQIKINDCKKHADIIAHNINQLWLRNWGKGPYQDKSIFGKDWDPVGGYLCWDWADAFFAVGKTHGGKHWCSSVGTAKPLESSLAIHYFTWLCACDCEDEDCCVVIDDGYLDGEYVHTNEEVDFFDNDDWEIVDYIDMDLNKLKPMKENNGYFDSEYTLTDED